MSVIAKGETKKMVANRRMSCIVEGKSFDIRYGHEWEGDLYLEIADEKLKFVAVASVQRDIVVNDLLFATEKHGGVDEQWLIRRGFRKFKVNPR